MLFFFFFSFSFSLPSLLLFLASCSRPFEIWLLASPPLRLVEDEVKGFRPFPLGFDRCGCSLSREEEEDEDEEEEESFGGSSCRDWGLLGTRDSSDVVEALLWRWRYRRCTAVIYIGERMRMKDTNVRLFQSGLMAAKGQHF